MTIRSAASTGPSGHTGLHRWRGATLRLLGLLLLVVQLGIIAHRIEHYVTPDRMECGEESCIAFAPAPSDPPPLPVIEPVLLVSFALSLWTVRAFRGRAVSAGIGFRALAPPAAPTLIQLT